MNLCQWLAAVSLTVLVGGTPQAAEPAQPLPFQAYRDFVQALHAQWYVPQAAALVAQTGPLNTALQSLCNATPDGESAALAQARLQWLQTVETWERFSSVRGGALLARRSPREIDFMPTRPPAIERAVLAAPTDAKAMEHIGTPAKGFPALEWLLWSQPVRAASAECRYAVQVTAAIHAEALTLQQAYALALHNGWDDPQAEYAMYEFLNLWDAGLQKLWWEDMERPSRKTVPGRRAVYARNLSEHTVEGWRAQWLGLRQLAIGKSDSSGGPINTDASGTLHAYLRVQGHPAQAERLLQNVMAVDRAMAQLSGSAEALKPERIGNVVAALKAMQLFAETDMADALHFVISFFDEDGD